MRVALDLEPDREFDWSKALFVFPQLFWDWEQCVDKADKSSGSEKYSVNHNPSSLSHPFMLIFHVPAIDSSWPKNVLAAAESVLRKDDKSPSLFQQENSRLWPATVHRVHPFHRDSLMNVSGSLIRVCVLHITCLFDDVITSECVSMWLFTALIRCWWWHVIPRVTAVGNKRSRKTDHRLITAFTF